MPDTAFAGRPVRGGRLLWTGQPSKGLLLRAQDAFLIPFSALWCAIPLFGLLGGGGATAAKAGLSIVIPALFVTIAPKITGMGMRLQHAGRTASPNLSVYHT